jgi:hypothetical protein
MTIQELVRKFPEIPPDLHNEPLLAQFAETLGDLLQAAQNPSNCAGQYEAHHYYYLKLIGPLKLYMYGLSTREKTLKQLQDFLERYQANPDGFATSLIPSSTPA